MFLVKTCEICDSVFWVIDLCSLKSFCEMVDSEDDNVTLCVDDSKVRCMSHYDTQTIRALATQAGVHGPISKKSFNVIRSVVLMHFLQIGSHGYKQQYVDMSKTMKGQYVMNAIKDLYGVCFDDSRNRARTRLVRYTSDSLVAYRKLVAVVAECNGSCFIPEFLVEDSSIEGLWPLFEEIVARKLASKNDPTFTTKQFWVEVFEEFPWKVKDLWCAACKTSHGLDCIGSTYYSSLYYHEVWDEDTTSFESFEEWWDSEVNNTQDFFSQYNKFMLKKVLPKLEVSESTIRKTKERKKLTSANPFMTDKTAIYDILFRDFDYNDDFEREFETWWEGLEADFMTDEEVSYNSFKDLMDTAFMYLFDRDDTDVHTLRQVKIFGISKFLKKPNTFTTDKDAVRSCMVAINDSEKIYESELELKNIFECTWESVGCGVPDSFSVSDEDEYGYFKFITDRKVTRKKYKELIKQVFGSMKGGKMVGPDRQIERMAMQCLEGPTELKDNEEMGDTTEVMEL